MAVYIAGLGWMGAAGTGHGLRSPFSWPAGELPTIRRADVFKGPNPHFGRMDRYSKLGLAAVGRALHDAGVGEDRELKAPVALIASTVHGCLETDVDFFSTVLDKGPALASPHLFAYTLSNTFLGEAAIQFGCRGPSILLHEPILEGTLALACAIRLVLSGEARMAVVGVCDLGPPPSISTQPSAPGALFFVLDSEEGRRSYGLLDMAETGEISIDGSLVPGIIELARHLTNKVSS